MSSPAPDDLPKWLQFVDHTADAGILIRAPNPEQLFERAAWGMFSLITDVESVRPEECIHITVDASDRAGLLVRWLSELNFRHVTEHRLFSRFTVTALSDRRLEADVFGAHIDPTRDTVFTEIKAVTFHDLQLEQDAHEWRAQVIFDL
jgi:SHS2 domain-containing protein